MQVRRFWLAITIITLALASVAAFAVSRNKDRASDSTARIEVPQSPGRESRMLQRLPNNLDGLEFERTVVPDTPFSATLIIESNESKPDGSVITKTATSLIYRDEKGRTRRDWLSESANGAEAAVARRSVINDPLSGFSYALDHRANVAQRTGFVGVPPQSATQDRATQAASRDQILPLPSTSGTGTNLQTGKVAASPGQTPEAIGIRDIEGELAEGTRFSFTLPAKADQEPVEIVTERWYARSIRAVVLIKRTDPRAGETIYRLTNIKRGEPAQDLFIVPDNYKVTNDKGRELRDAEKPARD